MSDFVSGIEIDDDEAHHIATHRFQANKFTIVDQSDSTKVLQFDCSGITSGQTSTFTVPDVDGTYVTLAATQALSNKTFQDSTCTFVDNADATKKLAFQCSGLTTATTRTWTVPDSSDTMVGLATTDTLTNKTLTNPTINAATLTGAIARAGRTRLINGIGKVGAGAGWAVGAAADTGYMGTVAASQTAGTFVVQIPNLTVGDTITGFYPIAQIESAGGAVTLDCDLRTHVNVAADPTDASVGAMTQVSVTADTSVGVADIKSGLSHVVLATNSYYFLLTVTTAASTDIILLSMAIVVTES